MFNSGHIRADFNRSAPHYDAHAQLQQRVQQKLLRELATLPPRARLLDAGCGTGSLARVTGQHCVVALDHAYDMCVQAQRHTPLTVNADMNQLPFAPGHFDMVFSSLALQWSPDWRASVQEWLRVVKPGGSVVFSTFSQGTLSELSFCFAQVDAHAHVSEFVTADAILSFPGAVCEEETITEYYPDLHTLSRHLKALGARNKSAARRRSLMTPRGFTQVGDLYRARYGTAQGLPVTWNILYTRVSKP